MTIEITTKAAAIVSYLLVSVVVGVYMKRLCDPKGEQDGSELLGLFWPAFLVAVSIDWFAHARLRYRAGAAALEKITRGNK